MEIEEKLRNRPTGDTVTILKDQIVNIPELNTKGLLEFWHEGGISALSLILLKDVVAELDRDKLVEICEMNIESMKNEQKTFQTKGDYFFINFNFRTSES